MPRGRGLYRGVYSSLPDDPEFQRLTPTARLVFYTARLCAQAGPAAIFRYYPELLMIQTGLPAKGLENALKELEQENWIYREGCVLWIRNGLRHDPTMCLSDRKHRVAVERAIAALPRVGLVLKFCDYYKITRPFDEASQVGSPRPRPTKKKKTEEAETDSASPGASQGPPPAEELTPDGLMDLFNEATPDATPAIVTRSPERYRKAKAALLRFPKRQFWVETFAMFHKGRFLQGLSPPSPGHEKFVADFDWLLSRGKDGTENAVKVHDGKYS